MAVILISVDPVQLTASATTIYVCPANTSAKVLKCTACNSTTDVPTFTVYKVPSGGSAGTDRLLINGRTIGSQQTDSCPEVVNQALNAGDSIAALASTSSEVTFALSVVEIV